MHFRRLRRTATNLPTNLIHFKWTFDVKYSDLVLPPYKDMMIYSADVEEPRLFPADTEFEGPTTSEIRPMNVLKSDLKSPKSSLKSLQSLKSL